MTPTPCEVGPSLSRTQTLIATRVPCGGWREQQGSGRPFTRTRNQKRLNNGRLGGNTPRPAAFPSEGHGARKCLPSDPCTVHSRQFQNGQPSISHPGGAKENTQPRRELQDILRRVHQNRRWPSNLIRLPLGSLFGPLPSSSEWAAIDSHPGGWKIPPKTHNHEDELRRVSTKLQSRFLRKLRVGGGFGR